MPVRLLPGSQPDHAVRLLNEALSRLGPVRSPGTFQPVDVFNGYVQWASSQLPVLASVVNRPTLDELVTSRGYYLIHGVDPRALGMQLTNLVISEVELRVRAFEAAIADITTRRARWSGTAALVVPDTSVLMGQRPYLPEAPWWELLPESAEEVEVVILQRVLVELDHQKDRGDPVKKQKAEGEEPDDRHSRQRAARVLAWLEGHVDSPLERFGLAPHSESGGPPVWGRLLLDDLHHAPLAVADSEIISRALDLQQIAEQEVTLTTYDRNMLFSARCVGLRAVRPATGQM